MLARNKNEKMRATGWPLAALLTLIVMCGILLLFRQTFVGMATTWWTSPTYSYGLVVILVAAFLVWERRRELALVTPQPIWKPIPFMLVAGLVWLLTHVLTITWLEQFAAIGLLVLSVWAVLGNKAARTLLLPLALLFLAIPPTPLHDAIVRPLIDVTGDIAVTLLSWTDVKFTRQGDIISLGSGSWSIEKACSGVRYFFASVILGILFASRAFRSWQRRLLFIGFAMVLPVLANGVRVYAIIMIGQLKSQTLALDVDHVLVGGIFAGILMTLMFLVGAIWWERKDENREPAVHAEGLRESVATKGPDRKLVISSVVCLLIAAIWSGIGGAITAPSAERGRIDLQAPAGTAGWRINRKRLWGWWVRVGRIDGEFYTFYQRKGQTVALFVGQSLGRQAGAELVDSKNVTVVKDPLPWDRGRRSQPRTAGDPENNDLDVVQSLIETPTFGGHPKWYKLVVWQWYRVGGRYTSNPYVARLMGLWSSLVEGRTDAALIVVATPYQENSEQGAVVLGSFVDSMLPEIEAELERSRQQGSG